MRAGEHQSEPEFVEDHAFHFDHVGLGVGVRADVDEVVQRRRIDLLVLRGDEQTGRRDELEDLFADLVLLQVPVYHGDRDEESLHPHLELAVHVDEPVDHDVAHLFRDVFLVIQIRRIANVVVIG